MRQHRGDYIYFSAAILMPILSKTLAFSVHWSHPQMVDVKIWLWNGEPCWLVLFAKKARLNHMQICKYMYIYICYVHLCLEAKGHECQKLRLWSFRTCAGDWEAVTPTRCDPVRGQRVTFVAPSDCFGGAKPPKDYWEPCPGVAWWPELWCRFGWLLLVCRSHLLGTISWVHRA